MPNDWSVRDQNGSHWVYKKADQPNMCACRCVARKAINQIVRVSIVVEVTMRLAEMSFSAMVLTVVGRCGVADLNHVDRIPWIMIKIIIPTLV